MADAQITLKLTAAEFDLLREALEYTEKGAVEVTRRAEVPAPDRAEARTLAFQIGELRKKIT